MNKCIKCGTEFEGEAWKKVCIDCYAKRHEAEEAAEAGFSGKPIQVKAEPRDVDIRIARSVAIKCAVDTLPEQGRVGSQVIALAEDYTQWILTGKVSLKGMGK